MSDCQAELCRNWTGNGCACEVFDLDKPTFRVDCECGYDAQGLTEERARRFAAQHTVDDDEGIHATAVEIEVWP
jgi:hypothetical protein